MEKLKGCGNLIDQFDMPSWGDIVLDDSNSDLIGKYVLRDGKVEFIWNPEFDPDREELSGEIGGNQMHEVCSPEIEIPREKKPS